MVATKTAGRATTKRAAAATTGKVSPRGKGKAARAATASSATATAPAPANATSGYDAAPEASVACGTGAGPEARSAHLGRARKPLSARSAKKIADTLKLAGESTRVRIIWNLRATGPMNVTAMCESFGLAQPAVSHHLGNLRMSGIVEATREGKNNRYALTTRGELLAEAMNGIEASGS